LITICACHAPSLIPWGARAVTLKRPVSREITLLTASPMSADTMVSAMAGELLQQRGVDRSGTRSLGERDLFWLGHRVWVEEVKIAAVSGKATWTQDVLSE
jgi:hypothetical protein